MRRPRGRRKPEEEVFKELSRGAGGEERNRGQSREAEDEGRTAWALQAPVRIWFLL